MTSDTIFGQLDPSQTPNDAQSRKRRRRTAGGGAQDDCFACRKRGTACDRKRPYCTQCINIGKECSGYKTTLTWGVGVASRGKLRGLSLPIAKSPVEGSTTPHETKRRKSSASKSNIKAPTSQPNGGTTTQKPAPIAIPKTQSFAPKSYSTSADLHSTGSWQIPSYSASSPTFSQYDMTKNPSLKYIQTSLGPRFDALNFPSSASSTGSFTDLDFHTPIEYSQTPQSLTFPDHYQSSYGSGYLDSSVDPVSPTTMEYSESLAQSGDPTLDVMSSYSGTISSMEQVMSSSYQQSLEQLPEIGEEELLDERMLPYIDARFSNHLFHLSPRLQTLINYYDTSICPFLVAFDSPQNPYRMHIIQLAAHNEGLQHALAALAVNNMRMRGKQTRSLGFVEDINDSSEPSIEETRYKQSSIEQLNMHLVHASAAQDDSVLATLLILCLFHVCDSGFSKFKTQLAGVQKLMSLRDPTTESPFTGWVEMFFIWFDVMTAAVNNREPQIKGESLDMMDYSVNLGALEQYSGCDGRLFKLIARLGGLSLLAQGRTTSRSTFTPTLSPEEMVRSMRKRRPTAKAAMNRSLDASDYEFLDGNGWGTPVFSSDEEGSEGFSDDRQDFWREWNEIRSRLQSWEVDASTLPTDSAGTSTSYDASRLTSEQKDLVHISESFRHSALLYTERLAYPCLPSSAPGFQHHVSQALYHITSLPVTSCVNKFLLWPLFITGTECVDDGDRAVVRTRCIEIQRESGFYNNISCLEVLEKVWSDVNMGQGDEGEIHARRRDSEVLAGGESRQAFRWRRAMDRVDGEYLII